MEDQKNSILLTESNLKDVYRNLAGMTDNQIDDEEYAKILKRFEELVNYKKY